VVTLESEYNFIQSEYDFIQAIKSNRRSAEAEGIVVDPRVEELSLRQFKGEITGKQARREILRINGLDPNLIDE
jgi:hypothetical protein